MSEKKPLSIRIDGLLTEKAEEALQELHKAYGRVESSFADVVRAGLLMFLDCELEERVDFLRRARSLDLEFKKSPGRGIPTSDKAEADRAVAEALAEESQQARPGKKSKSKRAG